MTRTLVPWPQPLRGRRPRDGRQLDGEHAVGEGRARVGGGGYALRPGERVLRVDVGVGQRDRLGDPRAAEAAHVDRDLRGLPKVAVDEEHGGPPVIDRRDGVDDGCLAVTCRVVRRGLDHRADHLAGREPARDREREERRLPPGWPAGLGHDRRDHVDQLGERRRGDPVAVLEQRHQQVADDDGVRDRVDVLEQARRVGPFAAGLGRLLALLVLLEIPDIPFIERKLHLLLRSLLVADVVGRRDDGVDVVVHVKRRGEEGAEVAVELLVVRVARHVVDVLVAVLEHGALPVAEGWHARAGGAADHQLEVLVGHLHGGGGAGGELPVVVGGHEALLPRAVHLVAQAPHAHVVRARGAVRDAQVRQRGAGGVVGVLEQVEGGQDAPGAQVHGQHQLGAGQLQPPGELVKADLVRLERAPREVAAHRARLPRADRVLPPEARDEVAARVPYGRAAELPDELDDVHAESVLVRGRVPGLVEPGIDAPAEVLDERAEGAAPDGRDDGALVELDVGTGQCSGPFRQKRADGARSRRRPSCSCV